MRSRLAVAALVTLVAAACGPSRTEVVVVITTDGVEIPADLDTLNVVVTDVGVTPVDTFIAPSSRFCAGAARADCLYLPVTLTLVPGAEHPHDPVHVAVTASSSTKAGNTIADAAQFTFVDGVSERLDFVLYPECLGTDCAAMNQICIQSGKCAPATPTPFGGEPAVDGGAAVGHADASAFSDGGGDDLRGPDGADLTSMASPDLTPSPAPDLASAPPDLQIAPPPDFAHASDMKGTLPDFAGAGLADFSTGGDALAASPDLASTPDIMSGASPDLAPPVDLSPSPVDLGVDADMDLGSPMDGSGPEMLDGPPPPAKHGVPPRRRRRH